MSIWETVAAPIIAIINKVVPDKAAAAAATATLQQMQLQGGLADELAQLQAITVNQSDINKVEAANPSLFVAGPRPAIMWVCAGALLLNYWPRAIAGVTMWVIQCYHTKTLAPYPDLGMADLLGLTGPLLGLGAMRSFDKFKGTDTKAVGNK
jgi:hypothetical protein